MRRQFFLLIGVLCFAPSHEAAAELYAYPFDDPWVATVVGTPDAHKAKLPEKLPLKRRSVTMFADRVVPDVFWYDETLRYSYARQRAPAPLIFLIAGTGGAHDGTTMQVLARAFYQAGFHVILLPSPTYSNFIVSASRTSVPGHAQYDAEDLYRVMERVWSVNQGKMTATSFSLAGFSMGGFNAAFVARLDERRRVFKFRKALLINPPLRLYNSISLLDRMLENIPGGVDNFGKFYSDLVAKLTAAYERSERIEFSEGDTLYRAYRAYKPRDEQLAALIGVSFRFASANLAFTSDVMTNFGFIKPKNLILGRNSSLEEYAQVSLRLGFTDYFHEYFYPYYKTRNPAITRAELIGRMSLESIEDYLRTASNIAVMHNANDLILEPGEIDFFHRVFGDRAKIYPVGGHLGNIEYRDNIAHMLRVVQE